MSRTWLESVLQVWHQVVFPEDQLPVQVGDVQVGQCAKTLNDKLLGLLLVDLSRQVTNVVLQATEHKHKHLKAVAANFSESTFIGHSEFRLKKSKIQESNKTEGFQSCSLLST